MNLWDLLSARAVDRPDAPALRFAGASPSFSHRGLLDAAEAVAAFLAGGRGRAEAEPGMERREGPGAEAGGAPGAGPGVGPGDRVVLIAPNRPETVLAYLAVLRLGAVAVPVNPAFRAPELTRILADAAPRLAIVGEEAAATLPEVTPEARESLEAVLRLEELPGVAPERATPGRSGPERTEEPASPGAGPGLPPPPDGPDPALLVYTSGTTGRSKGAVLTHDNLLATVSALLAAWAWTPEDVLLLTLPLFHVHGLVVGLFTALAAGATVELRERFDAAGAARELAEDRARGPAPTHPGRGRARPLHGPRGTGPEKSGPTVFFGVPTVYVRLLAALRDVPDRRGLDRVRLFASGSAPLAPETFHAFREATGHEILERYGMSETGMNLSNQYAGPRRPGTVGVPLPGVSIRIVDPEDPAGVEVQPGGDGELLVAGSNVFTGYWRNPEASAAAFVTDASGRRWFRTGDLARRDPETGYVTLLGRRHELVIRGGENVYPREVEEVLEALPGVREAAVAGRAHPEWGEVPVAWVVAEDGGTPLEGGAPDPDALLAACRERLAPFKVPAEVRFVPALPRNALGKVQKHRLGEAAGGV
ncbi:MAG: AMP-binding protein [Thermoanaerobaculia bacterium]